MIVGISLHIQFTYAYIAEVFACLLVCPYVYVLTRIRIVIQAYIRTYTYIYIHRHTCVHTYVYVRHQHQSPSPEILESATSYNVVMFPCVLAEHHDDLQLRTRKSMPTN